MTAMTATQIYLTWQDRSTGGGKRVIVRTEKDTEKFFLFDIVHILHGLNMELAEHSTCCLGEGL